MYSAHRTRQNIELLASLMENSAFGGLSQVFILHAIATVANAVSKRTRRTSKAMMLRAKTERALHARYATS